MGSPRAGGRINDVEFILSGPYVRGTASIGTTWGRLAGAVAAWGQAPQPERGGFGEQLHRTAVGGGASWHRVAVGCLPSTQSVFNQLQAAC